MRDHDLGMVFQEGALFDSLTVGENVGYKLYEETDMPLAEVGPASRKCWGSSGSAEHVDRNAVGAVGRAAAPRGHRPGHGRQAEAAALRRADDRPRPDDGADRGRRDHQAARPRRASRRCSSRTSCATPSTSRRTLRRGLPEGHVIASASQAKIEEADFVMLRDGKIAVRGLGRRAAIRDRSVSAGVPVVGD